MTNWLEPDGWIPWIRHAQPDDFWLWTLAVLGIGSACGFGIFHYLRRARIIENTPTSRVASAAQGYVELQGLCEPFAGTVQQAPLSKFDCVWYSYCTEKHVSGSRGKSEWRTIHSGRSEAPFALRDASGVCVIDPRGAEVTPASRDVWYGNTEWPLAGPQLQAGFFKSNDYRYTEERLHPQDFLYALGLFRTVDPNNAQGSTLSDEVKALLRTWKQDQATLVAQFDTNQDGQIDLREWDTVRAAAENQVQQQRFTRPLRPSIHVMTKTGDFRRPYLLSIKSQEDMARRYRWLAFACTLVFTLCGPVALWMIWVRLF
jgi:E3 Ubiquitin ligase